VLDALRAATERLLSLQVVAHGNRREQRGVAGISIAAEQPPCEPGEPRSATVSAYAAGALSICLPLNTDVSNGPNTPPTQRNVVSAARRRPRTGTRAPGASCAARLHEQYEQDDTMARGESGLSRARVRVASEASGKRADAHSRYLARLRRGPLGGKE
jgi:hypothetical protein